jgi:hypothetical protein
LAAIVRFDCPLGFGELEVARIERAAQPISALSMIGMQRIRNGLEEHVITWRATDVFGRPGTGPGYAPRIPDAKLRLDDLLYRQGVHPGVAEVVDVLEAITAGGQAKELGLVRHALVPLWVRSHCGSGARCRTPYNSNSCPCELVQPITDFGTSCSMAELVLPGIWIRCRDRPDVLHLDLEDLRLWGHAWCDDRGS